MRYMDAMSYARTKSKEAHDRFESLVKTVVERELGCEIWQGLADGRVGCTAGVFYVDGKPVCIGTPVRFEEGAFKFEFRDLMHGGVN